MLQFLVFAFLAYLLYKLIFGFIIPVYRATRQVKKSFRDMQEQMNARMGGQGAYGPTPEEPRQPEPKKGDYIDFEEVK